MVYRNKYTRSFCLGTGQKTKCTIPSTDGTYIWCQSLVNINQSYGTDENPSYLEHLQGTIVLCEKEEATTFLYLKMYVYEI